LTQAIEKLTELTQGLIGTVIQALADTVVAVLNGTEIHISVLGVVLAVTIGPSDSSLVGAEDRIRTDLSLSAFGSTLTSSVRVLRLGDGQHTIAATASLGGDDWSVDLTLDPLQKVFEHVVEARGFFGGHILEITAPEVERVQKVSFAMSDIPVLSQALRSIPSPVPGTKFSFDAGMELCFNVLDRTSLLINEVELNPSGRDASNEWVELFNPSSLPIDVAGWSLATSRGQQKVEVLSGTVPGHGYLVHRFTGQALDNGEVKGFPLQESVTLLDAAGKRVDSAPWLKDLSDDQRTWQRSFDGSSRWELRNGTEGRTNGLVLLTEIGTEQLVSLIGDCFAEAFERFAEQGFDIYVLDELIKDALLRLKDKLLDMIETTVSSLNLFVKLGLADLTGSGTAGLSVALVYDGRAVRACLEWMIDTVGGVLRDPLNPLAAAQRTEVPVGEFADHVHLQFGVFVAVGTPDIFAIKGTSKVVATAVIKINLGALGVFAGGSGWNIGFGLVITGTQAIKLNDRPVAGGCSYDVWLLRGSLRPA
jgi:hypothetical protein